MKLLKLRDFNILNLKLGGGGMEENKMDKHK
jgi:hypothetical protein